MFTYPNQLTSAPVQLVPGQLTKYIHQQGTGQLPNKGQRVSALYRGTLHPSGAQFDSNQNKDSPFEFTLGQGQVIKGWDEGFASMKVGQKASLICEPQYAYGARGSPPKIPANSTLRFDVELLACHDKKKQKWDMSAGEKITQATLDKIAGTEAFKRGDYQQALRQYNSGIQMLQDQDGEAKPLLLTLRLNAAQASINCKDYQKAIERCMAVLKEQPENHRALYRCGVARSRNGDYNGAKNDLSRLLILDPSNSEVQRQLAVVHQAQQQLRRKQKKVFGGMFSKGGIYADEQLKGSKKEEVEQKPKIELGDMPKMEENGDMPKMEESGDMKQQ